MSTTQRPFAPSVPSVFGPIVTGAHVEEAVIRLIRKWSGTYLAELERRNGLEAGQLARLRSWQTAPTFDNWPEDQLPGCIVVSPGLDGEPIRRGDGNVTATFSIGLGFVVVAATQELSHRYAMLYIAAHRALILQKPSLEGFANGVRWVTESYDELPFDDVRSLGAGMGVFNVEVRSVVNTSGGPQARDPLEPDTDPWPDWPSVQRVEVDVDGTKVVKPDEGG